MQALVETKFYRPRKSARFVSRPRLVDQLNEGRDRKLTLICAPAGFGKTALLSDWIHGSDRPVAWLSLDVADNQPIRFMSYLISALSRIDDKLTAKSAAMARLAEPPLAVWLETLVNDMNQAGAAFVLVLDDYHLITDREVHNAVAFLVENVPVTAHVAIAGRLDPPLPLARWRVGDEVTEVRAADLRFDDDEAASFLNSLMGLDLSAEDVALLEGRTEGWIAGLHLAALSLKNQQDKHAFVTSFSGSHRHVFDYLVDESLSEQPREIQQFLLATSVLDKFCAGLCDHVLGVTDSQEQLEYLEKNNLFLVPLDDQRRWWRYHHLFGDFLKQRLRRQGPDSTAELHSRAAGWLRENNLAAEAAEHALASGDHDLAAEIIEPLVEGLLVESRLSPILAWKERLSDEAIARRPWLCVCLAWTCLLTGRGEELQSLLAWAQTSGAKIPGQEERITREVPQHIAVIRSFIFRFQGDYESAIEMASEPYEYGAKGDALVRTTAALNIGVSYLSLGRPAEALAYLREGVSSGIESKNYYTALTCFGCLGAAQGQMGALREAASTCRQAIESGRKWGGGRPLPATGYAYIFLADILYEWDQLDEAESHVSQAIELSAQVKELGVRLDSHVVLAEIQKVRGRLKEAAKSLEIAEECARHFRKSELVYPSLVCMRAELAMARGDDGEAGRWAEEMLERERGTLDFSERRIDLAVAAVLLARNEPGRSVDLLEKVLASAQSGERLVDTIRSLAQLATAYRQDGREAEAVDTLARALALAEAEGYVRVFLNQGPAMAELLKILADSRPNARYAKKLLQAFRSSGRPASAKRRGQAGLLIDPLSERELEVLGLLAEGLKYQDMADKLVVSVNTIRAHTKNIYSKLGVNSAGQATKRAADLGLLEG